MAWSSSKSPALVAMMVLVTLAGCIEDPGAQGDDGDAEPFVDPMAYEEGHEHADYAQHGSSWNMTELGWTSMGEESVAWGEMDVHPDHDIGLVAFAWPTAGFATVDLSDPTEPRLIETTDLGFGYGADVKWDPSGEWAVLAIQAHSQLGLPAPLIDPLAATAESGIELFHITEEGVIHDVDAWYPMPDRGVHMVYTHEIDGREYVFAAYNGKGVGVMEIIEDDPPVGARLVPVNSVLTFEPTRAAGAPTTGGLSGAHDMTVIDDPVLEKPLLWVAHGYDGLFVFDLSDPHDPLWPDEPLGSWRDEGNTWFMHTVQATVLEDGSRRVVLIPEVFSDAEAEVVAPLWVLDATDLSDIRLETTWRNPGDHGAELLRFSVHNFQLVDDHVVLAHYHGGVWLLEIDASAEETVDPVGYHVPGNDPGWEMSGIYHNVYNMMDAPTVWDVVVHDGVVWATDVNSGVYAVEAPSWAPGDGAHSLG